MFAFLFIEMIQHSSVFKFSTCIVNSQIIMDIFTQKANEDFGRKYLTYCNVDHKTFLPLNKHMLFYLGRKRK